MKISRRKGHSQVTKKTGVRRSEPSQAEDARRRRESAAETERKLSPRRT